MCVCILFTQINRANWDAQNYNIKYLEQKNVKKYKIYLI